MEQQESFAQGEVTQGPLDYVLLLVGMVLFVALSITIFQRYL